MCGTGTQKAVVSVRNRQGGNCKLKSQPRVGLCERLELANFLAASRAMFLSAFAVVESVRRRHRSRRRRCYRSTIDGSNFYHGCLFSVCVCLLEVLLARSLSLSLPLQAAVYQFSCLEVEQEKERGRERELKLKLKLE